MRGLCANRPTGLEVWLRDAPEPKDASSARSLSAVDVSPMPVASGSVGSAVSVGCFVLPRVAARQASVRALPLRFPIKSQCHGMFLCTTTKIPASTRNIRKPSIRRAQRSAVHAGGAPRKA